MGLVPLFACDAAPQASHAVADQTRAMIGSTGTQVRCTERMAASLCHERALRSIDASNIDIVLYAIQSIPHTFLTFRRSPRGMEHVQAPNKDG